MIEKLLNIGVTNALGFEDKLRAKFLNTANLLFAAVLIYFVFYHLFSSKLYHVALILFVFLLSVPATFWLQYKGKQKAARLALFITLHATIFMTSMVVLVGHGNEYYYIAVSILILTQSKKSYWAMILIFINISLYILPHFVYPHINEHYKLVTALSVYITTLLSVRFFIIIQNQYRDELRVQKERLTELNMEKNDLMSIVAHDLKSPLAQIKGLVSILELEGNRLTSEQVNLIKKIKSVTTTQHQQITTFLDAKALDEKMEQITYKDFDVVKSIKLVIENMTAIAKSKNINIVESYSASQINTFGSIDCLNKIISNLTSNAIKYSHANSTVTINVTADDRQILITVKDEGQGFNKEDLQKVFFKNKVLSAKPTASETATGLGLYIVKKYVDIMNGWVWLESTERKGTTFFIKLPKGEDCKH